MQIPRYLKNVDSLIAAFIGFYAIYLYTKYSGVGISARFFDVCQHGYQPAGTWLAAYL